ncbi:FMN-binding protein [Actinomycetospora sp. CA-101289]|uniref:FMN-binding protein n=1 Tax=Actinomycetospora sp. CA-101289 TaxID=3239893 RepID=UPI003D9567DF
MRRILLWFLTTVSTVVLLFGYRTSTSSALPDIETGTGDTATAASSPGSSGTPATTTSTYTGTVTGVAADTRWGPVQVRATLAGGRITAVDVVEYPTANGKDREINAEAVPELVQETLEAQSADIDMVSGATVTSTGYVQSLQSALDQAGIA